MIIITSSIVFKIWMALLIVVLVCAAIELIADLVRRVKGK